MKRYLTGILTVIGYVLIVTGVKTTLIGALYEIQGWESPFIAGGQVNVLLLGLLLTSGGAMLVLASKLVKKEDRLELDPERVPRSAEKVEELLENDDQYV